ncbi:MAG: thiamine pyrophosphate-binding protein [Anaerolineae bacterium]|nr:thiamine pyrophosphate-binding protein [Anaerolineae bacterium]
MATTMTTSDTMVADVIAQYLTRLGLRYVFGHPGGETAHLIDAFRRAGVPFLLTHHEATAAFMAAAYGDLTGIPGVCLATLGPGATNMVTGVANAYLDRSPVVALTAQLSLNGPKGATHQLLDLNQLYGAVAKGSRLVTAENVYAAVREATAVALEERPGPFHLAVPSDVAAIKVTPLAHSDTAAPTNSVPSPSPQALAKMDALLARSSRPAIIAGLGALRSQAQDAVTNLAHRWRAPVAVTPKGKGLIPEDDPLFAGAIEMAGNDIVVGFLQRADLILAAGLDVAEMDKPWLLGAPVIHLDTVPNREGYYPTEVELCGNVRPLLNQVTERVSRQGAWTDEELAQHRARLRDYVCPPSARLQPYQVVETFREAMGREAMATCDVGANKFLVGQVWKTYRAGTFMMSNGLSSMGYSIPTAATMKLLNPQRQVVAFVGDGGLSMYLGELETLKRLQIGLPIVVLVDNSLELIRRSQERRGYVEIGTTFTNPDFGLLARSFGLPYYQVTNVDECRRAAEEVIQANRLSLIAAEIDGHDYHL